MGHADDAYPPVNLNQQYTDNRLNNEPMYPGQPQPPPNVVYVQAHNQPGLYCPVCSQNTNSYTTFATGNITWIWCLVLLFFTGICCWIPFVCDSCK